MKIILSPSKTQDFNQSHNAPMTLPLFEGKSVQLNNLLKRTSKKALSTLMKIEGDLLNKTYADIQSFRETKPNHAIATYTGLVYKYFDLAAYGASEFDYLNNHLIILSAMYGVLRPYDGMKPYRLDMKMKPSGKDLYNYWSKELDAYFENEEVIIDLASTEFSKLVHGHKITVGFRELKKGQYKNLATYAKIARGMLLHQMVMNKLDSVEALMALEFGDYHFNKDLSTDTTILFTRGDCIAGSQS